MENASKALLFAAGILIAIILISVAIYLVNMANDATDGVGSAMTEMQLMQFNQKFESYEGVRTGSQIKQLVSTVNANNVDNAGTDSLVEMVDSTGSSTKIIEGDTNNGYTFKGGSAKKYKVEITYDNNAVKTITLKSTNSSSSAT